LDENFARLITTFDEVPLPVRTHGHEHGLRRSRFPFARGKGVDLKRRPPKSRPTAIFPPNGLRTSRSSEIAVRGDSAVHVSLSSDSPVKQPGTRAKDPLSVDWRAARSRELPMKSEA
jgi:hypothetical protein